MTIFIDRKLINFVCDLLVRKKIKKQFGGNLKAFVSGGGALDKEVGCIFKFNWISQRYKGMV